jgi:CO/xanthine dehydrogenase FAD-binding subunit
MERGSGLSNLLPCLSRVIQDLERSHDRREYLHVLASRPDDNAVTALEATYTLWPRGGEPREVAAIDFITGSHSNVLKPGELLRSIRLPASSLKKRFASHRSSLTHLGRSALFLIGTRSHQEDDLLLTITAATPRPIQLKFARAPSAAELRQAIDSKISADGYFADVHGSPAYRRRLTYYYAEQIREDLARSGTVYCQAEAMLSVRLV